MGVLCEVGNVCSAACGGGRACRWEGLGGGCGVGHSFPIVVTPPNHLCSPEEGRGILLLKDARK